MPATPEVQFALKAINEASRVLKDIQADIGDLGEAAETSDKKLDGISDQLGDIAREAASGADSVGSYGDKLGNIGDAGGDAETALRGVGDITGFVSEQFGVSLGPMDQYVGSFGELAGGVEAAIKGFPGLITSLAGATTAAWAHVSALAAQAAAFIVANAPLLIMIGSALAIGLAIGALVLYWDEVKGAFTAAKDLLIEAGNAVLGFFRDNWPEIAVFLSGPFAPIVLLATDAFGVRTALLGAGQAVIDWFGGAWQAVGGFVTGAFTAIVGGASDAWGVKSALTGAFDSAITYVKELGGRAWEAAQNVGSNLADGLMGAIEGAVKGAGNLIIDVLNAIIGAINSVQIPGVHIPDWVPGVGGKGWDGWSPDIPTIPALAMGGIVTGPTMALIGEAGAEAVVPLASFDAAVTALDRIAAALEPRIQPGTIEGLTAGLNGGAFSQAEFWGALGPVRLASGPPPPGGMPAGGRMRGGTFNYYGPGDPHEFRRFLERAGLFA